MSSLETILKMKEEDLFELLSSYVRFSSFLTGAVSKKYEYIFAQGQSSVCLVAHLDTVFPYPPEKIFSAGRPYPTMWSPQGLGADDRAGVWAILDIIEAGFSPSVIFTCGEERGGIGALSLITDYPTMPIKANCFIQLDREGENDSVYYDDVNYDFHNYINSFGFQTQTGIFTDISILCPAWKVSGANLSIGTHFTHTKFETLNTRQLHETISKVKNILKNEPYETYNYRPLRRVQNGG